MGDEGVDWDVELRGHAAVGHDTNPMLAATPEQRRDVGGLPIGDESPDASPFAEGRTRLRLHLGRRWWSLVKMRVHGRQYFDGDSLAEERLGVEAGWRSRRWLVGLSVRGSRYDRERTADDSWAGRSRLRALLRLDPVEVGAHALAAVRAYDTGGQVDWRGGGGLELALRPGPWLLAAGIDGERRVSNTSVATRNELSGWGMAGVEIGWLDVDLYYVAYLRDFDSSERDGVEHLVGGRVIASPWEQVGLLLRSEYGLARADDPQALVYDRFEVLGGVRFELGWSKPAPLPSESAPRRQGGATLTDDGVRFRYRFPDAERVAVVGSFNGWDEAQGRLEPRKDGWFEATLAVPSGRHQYQLLVDGEPTVPAEADAYADDGFGGKNAVLDVP